VADSTSRRSTTARKDGSQQVAYNGLNLYYFAGDKKEGDTNGQGLGDVWYLVSPEGQPIKK
jgi:predicted lipoprotein with Yx(FWY)xxD motif